MAKPIDLSKIVTQPPSVNIDDVLAQEPFPSLFLLAIGTAVDDWQIAAGNYGIREADDTILDLGDNIDLMPFACRPQAIDMSNTKRVVKSYDPESPEFGRIVADSSRPNASGMYGVCFLVFERSQTRFLEFFCGTKSSRAVAKEIASYLPLTEVDIALRKLSGVHAREARALTLGSRVVRRGTYSWHVPVVVGPCAPFVNLPEPDARLQAISEFIRIAMPNMHRGRTRRQFRPTRSGGSLRQP